MVPLNGGCAAKHLSRAAAEKIHSSLMDGGWVLMAHQL